MALVSIQVPDAQLRELERLLNPKQITKAVTLALVDVKRAGKKLFADEVRKELNIKAGPAKEAVQAVIQKISPPSLTFSIVKKLTSLTDFTGTNISAKGGVRFKALKNKPALRLPFSFKATMHSGHTGAFVRHKGSPRGQQKTSYAKRKYDRTRKWAKLTPKGITQRLAIDQVFGTAVYSVVAADKPVFLGASQAILNQLRERFHERLESKVQGILSGAIKA